MIIREKINIFFFYLLTLIPVFILIGPSVSLIGIILLSFFTFHVIIYQNDFYFLNSFSIKLFLFLYTYLIFNSYISLDQVIGLKRNLGFLRFILLFIIINYFFYKKKDADNLFYIWLITIIILIIDICKEYFFGTNIFGWGGPDQPHADRVVSFFKDEPIAGAYLSGFALLIFGFLLEKLTHRNLLPWIFLLVSLFAILISGERSNTLKVFFGFTLMFLFFRFIKIKIKIFILTFVISFLFLIIVNANYIKSKFDYNNASYIKTRYIDQFFIHFSSINNLKKFVDDSVYFQLYRSGLAVFKNYPVLGVGNKNYRVETCSDVAKNEKFNYYCLTHPHQIYIELLAEHGIIGSLIILGVFFSLMFKILKNIILSKNYIQIGAFCFVIFVFTPFLPSGAFFNDFNLTILWLNISIMFACTKETNIFNKKHIKF